MADLKQIKLGTVVYDIKDAGARNLITALETWKNGLFNTLYPVGSIYLTLSADFDPNNVFTGTWEKFAAGKTLVGVDVNDTNFDTAGDTYGFKNSIIPNHTHTINDKTAFNTTDAGWHSHSGNGWVYSVYKGTRSSETVGGISGSGFLMTQVKSGGSWGGYGETPGSGTHSHTVPQHSHTMNNPTGGEDAANKNFQPSMAVYMWKRTA